MITVTTPDAFVPDLNHHLVEDAPVRPPRPTTRASLINEYIRFPFSSRCSPTLYVYGYEINQPAAVRYLFDKHPE